MPGWFSWLVQGYLLPRAQGLCVEFIRIKLGLISFLSCLCCLPTHVLIWSNLWDFSQEGWPQGSWSSASPRSCYSKFGTVRSLHWCICCQFSWIIAGIRCSHGHPAPPLYHWWHFIIVFKQCFNHEAENRETDYSKELISFSKLIKLVNLIIS